MNLPKIATLSIVDQAVLSLSNFITAILLARTSSQKDFGIYVLLFSYLLLAQSIQGAIITSPMATLGVSRHEDNALTYLGSLFNIQILLSLALLIIGVLIAFQFFPLMELQLIIGIGSLIFFRQMQEFLRRLLYTKINVSGALLIGISGHGLQLLLVISSFFIGILTLPLTIAVMSCTMLIATLYGLIQCRKYIRWNKHLGESFLENWSFGKWLLASNSLTWTSSYAFSYLAAFFIGLQGPAILQACGNLLGPTNIVMNGMENIVPPTAAKKYQSKGQPALSGYLRVVGIAGLAGLATYLLVIGIFSEYILDFLYQGKYNNYTGIVWLLGLSYLFSFMMRVSAVGLRTLQKTKKIFYAYLTSTIVTVILGVPLVIYYAVEGAAAGSLLTAGITSVIVTLAFRRESGKGSRAK